MASVEKRQTNRGAITYIVKWREPDGKHRTKGGFATKKAAENYASKAEAALIAGIAFDPNAGKVLFRDVAQHWLESRKVDLKETTWRGYDYALSPAKDRRGDGKTLGIDAVFGGYPLNKITRRYIQAWVQRMVDAGKKPSTVRHAYFTVRMVLAQAVADNKISANPADYVKIPGEHSTNGGKPGVVDDPAQFLSAAQVSALVAAAPWPYNVLVHVAAWAGLRAAELGGLQVGDVVIPAKLLNPNAPAKLGAIRVTRTVRAIGPDMRYFPTKTKGSNRKVPLRAATTELLQDYLTMHPRADEPTAALFPNLSLAPAKPTGVRATAPNGEPDDCDHKHVARRQATALAELTVEEAEARLVLDWAEPLRHPTFYKAVYRPAVLRANRAATATGDKAAALPPELRFHALRHTYASLCAAVGVPVREVAKFMGHATTTTTEHIYTHLFDTDDHTDAMAALDALDQPMPTGNNVIPLHG
ncbi:tyrosine-type recombinase/integrase [Mycobacterium intracellulare]|uniref:tyrosine-type recombinase/integrase n=1 Tax=Mycobacterium intracellulare TaxID=1767 RepID=UPI001CD94A40|nr:tyrosine-type recombinase/integrase [Mycobacterium intracellulare]MCA2249959.1 tyrosine-type recombinase/integrase [Mycobacterium intracellulare]